MSWKRLYNMNWCDLLCVNFVSIVHVNLPWAYSLPLLYISYYCRYMLMTGARGSSIIKIVSIMRVQRYGYKLLIFPQGKIFTVVLVHLKLIQHVAFRCVHRICRVSVHGIKSYFVGTSLWQAGKWNVWKGVQQNYTLSEKIPKYVK